MYISITIQSQQNTGTEIWTIPKKPDQGSGRTDNPLHHNLYIDICEPRYSYDTLNTTSNVPTVDTVILEATPMQLAKKVSTVTIL